MVQVLNDACLGFMTSLGHQTGLFDLMAGLDPSTSGRIADAAGLTGPYDLVTTFDVIHDPAGPPRTLAAIAGAPRPDGVFRMATSPPAASWRRTSNTRWRPRSTPSRPATARRSARRGRRRTRDGLGRADRAADARRGGHPEPLLVARPAGAAA
ncbi:hypothetical protein [Kitasatospora sp. NPDC086791]|uniref:hypothetical protein n=1 Tax=Kitasatospora sp. NPDC086791 TaxID=3155178 RepID=UPI0034377D2B